MRRPKSYPFDPRYIRTGFSRDRSYKFGPLHFDTTPCYYCGEPSTSDDHTYPCAAMDALADESHLVQRRLLRIVPACTECNGILSDKVFDSLMRRKRYVKRRLRYRYKRLLAMPSWSDSELATLGERMRQHVLASLAHRDRILERLAW